MSNPLAYFVGFTLVVASGCDSHHAHEHDHDHADLGSETQAVCSDPNLTWESFGEPFMQDYCATCHSSQLEGEEARFGAPDEHDFDSLDDIRAQLDMIDRVAAGGPNSMNNFMPPLADGPSLTERTDLGIWLACERDRMEQP